MPREPLRARRNPAAAGLLQSYALIYKEKCAREGSANRVKSAAAFSRRMLIPGINRYPQVASRFERHVSRFMNGVRYFAEDDSPNSAL
jgi:hypothetical protein